MLASSSLVAPTLGAALSWGFYLPNNGTSPNLAPNTYNCAFANDCVTSFNYSANLHGNVVSEGNCSLRDPALRAHSAQHATLMYNASPPNVDTSSQGIKL